VDPELEEVVALELELLRPATRAAPDRLDRLLHPDFREVGASGRVWERAALIDAVAAEEPGEPRAAEDVAARRVAPGVVLLTYTARRAGRATRRSSLWVRDAGGWRVLFHQGTPAG